MDSKALKRKGYTFTTLPSQTMQQSAIHSNYSSGYRQIKTSLLVVILFALMSCQANQATLNGNKNLGVQSTRMVRTELIFGLSLNNGKFISAQEWTDFANQHLSPNFKEGLTIIDASGQWMLTDGSVVKEPSKIVVLFYKPDSNKDQQIRQCIDTYKKLFGQEAVLRSDTYVSVSF